MTVQEAQRAARRGGHRLVDAGRTPNGLYRMPVCERCGGKILARTPDEASGDNAVWSCTPREARTTGTGGSPFSHAHALDLEGMRRWPRTFI
jgi:hypothetical protein